MKLLNIKNLNSRVLLWYIYISTLYNAEITKTKVTKYDHFPCSGNKKYQKNI